MAVPDVHALSTTGEAPLVAIASAKAARLHFASVHSRLCTVECRASAVSVWAVVWSVWCLTHERLMQCDAIARPQVAVMFTSVTNLPCSALAGTTHNVLPAVGTCFDTWHHCRVMTNVRVGSNDVRLMGLTGRSVRGLCLDLGCRTIIQAKTVANRRAPSAHAAPRS